MCRQNNLIVAKNIEENIEKNNSINKNKHVMITGGNQGIGERKREFLRKIFLFF